MFNLLPALTTRKTAVVAKKAYQVTNTILYLIDKNNELQIVDLFKFLGSYGFLTVQKTSTFPDQDLRFTMILFSSTDQWS